MVAQKPNYAIKPTPELALLPNRILPPARLIAALGLDMKSLVILIFLVIGFLPFSCRARELELVFRGASANFGDAAEEYGVIWREEGEKIVTVLEAASGVELSETRIEVIVLEARSNSGSGAAPMRLRASYTEALKRGTLVHELAHRYLERLRLPRGKLSEHQKLNLLLLPVWQDLWGEDFIQAQVKAESEWSSHYRRDWEWAITMTEPERARTWEELLKSRRDLTMQSSRARIRLFAKTILSCRAGLLRR